MSWPEPDEGSLRDPEPQPEGARWPMSPTGLYPRERWLWFEQLFNDVSMLRDRYRLPVRAGWWEDQVQVETLAALAAWVERYDSGEWDDPPGKLALLYDLERIGALLRDGNEPFHPTRDRRLAMGNAVGCDQPVDVGPDLCSPRCRHVHDRRSGDRVLVHASSLRVEVHAR